MSVLITVMKTTQVIIIVIGSSLNYLTCFALYLSVSLTLTQ